MYFALMILIALSVIALVLLLENYGDPQTLEREYHRRPTLTNKRDLG